MSRFRDVMTDAMINVYDGFEVEMEKECLYCLERLKEANRAGDISLPYVNERGTKVQQGARIVMDNISEYWYQRMNNARRFVSREFEDKHNLWNRRVK